MRADRHCWATQHCRLLFCWALESIQWGPTMELVEQSSGSSKSKWIKGLLITRLVIIIHTLMDHRMASDDDLLASDEHSYCSPSSCCYLNHSRAQPERLCNTYTDWEAHPQNRTENQSNCLNRIMSIVYIEIILEINNTFQGFLHPLIICHASLAVVSVSLD